MRIVYIGPAGVTFTGIAYERLAKLFGAPSADDPDAELCLVERNEDVVPAAVDANGYGAIAMETKAQGRVDPPMNSFIELLEKYDGNRPISILGSIRMKLHFSLMVLPDMKIEDIDSVIAHPKAVGACCNRIKSMGLRVIESSSNGRAAEEVAENPKLSRTAALGPDVAAKKYGLKIISDAFEDEEAVTTFFLLGPKNSKISMIGENNRALFVFRAKHVPGALVRVLAPFADNGINLVHIHSLYTSNGAYDFAIEAEFGRGDIVGFHRAVARARENVKRNILFGPFPVVAI